MRPHDVVVLTGMLPRNDGVAHQHGVCVAALSPVLRRTVFVRTELVGQSSARRRQRRSVSPAATAPARADVSDGLVLFCQ